MGSMTAQTIEQFAASIGAEIVDLDLPWPDTRPILCRGVGCNCRAYVKYDHIAGYDYCSCRHSFGAHRKPDQKPKKGAPIMITISLPRNAIVSANHRGQNYMPKYLKMDALKNQAYWAAKAAKERYDGPVHLAITVAWPPLKRNRDRLNLAPSIKAIVDGFVKAGVLPDDNDKIIRSEHLSTADKPCKDAYGVVLTFEFQPIEEAA